MNPVDRLLAVWIRPDPDFAGSSCFRIRSDPDPEKTPDIRPDPDLDPDPVHLYRYSNLANIIH